MLLLLLLWAPLASALPHGRCDIVDPLLTHEPEPGSPCRLGEALCICDFIARDIGDRGCALNYWAKCVVAVRSDEEPQTPETETGCAAQPHGVRMPAQRPECDWVPIRDDRGCVAEFFCQEHGQEDASRILEAKSKRSRQNTASVGRQEPRPSNSDDIEALWSSENPDPRLIWGPVIAPSLSSAPQTQAAHEQIERVSKPRMAMPTSKRRAESRRRHKPRIRVTVTFGNGTAVPTTTAAPTTAAPVAAAKASLPTFVQFEDSSGVPRKAAVGGVVPGAKAGRIPTREPSLPTLDHSAPIPDTLEWKIGGSGGENHGAPLPIVPEKSPSLRVEEEWWKGREVVGPATPPHLLSPVGPLKPAPALPALGPVVPMEDWWLSGTEDSTAPPWAIPASSAARTWVYNPPKPRPQHKFSQPRINFRPPQVPIPQSFLRRRLPSRRPSKRRPSLFEILTVRGSVAPTAPPRLKPPPSDASFTGEEILADTAELSFPSPSARIAPLVKQKKS